VQLILDKMRVSFQIKIIMTVLKLNKHFYLRGILCFVFLKLLTLHLIGAILFNSLFLQKKQLEEMVLSIQTKLGV
jgi:hypothetical protein